MVNLAFKYLKFLLKAHSRRGHGIHSPFVFDLVSRVLDSAEDEKLRHLLEWRKQLEGDTTQLGKDSYGAGSLAYRTGSFTAGKLIRRTGIPHKYGSLLYKLIKEFKPETLIELGTGLGIGTAYIAIACQGKKVITIEGSAERSSYAQKQMEKMDVQNTYFLKGDFDQHLPGLVADARDPLILIIDGNHRYAPTIRYFEIALKNSNEDTILFFDDIRWSPEMERAWLEIIAHEKVVISIDFFRCGLVFFKRGMFKQHYLINY